MSEKWNENVETCSDCGIQWKKIGKSCPVCYSPPKRHSISDKEQEKIDDEILERNKIATSSNRNY